MAERTENYGLTIWGKEDECKSPAGLNGNFEMVDEVLAALAAGLCTFVRGSYIGTGAYPAREIEVGFQPSAVFLCTRGGSTMANGYVYGGWFFPDHPLRTESQYNYLASEVTEKGFTVSYSDSLKLATDTAGVTYYFLALKW